MGFPVCTSGKEPARQCRRPKRQGFNPWVRKISWRRAWQPTPVFLPRESPRAEEHGRLQSMGSQRVRHDWATKHSTGRRENNSFFRVKKTVSISLKLHLWHCKSASILLVVFLEGTRGRWWTCSCLISARGKAVFPFPPWDAERLHDQRQGMLQLAPWWVTSENGSLSPSGPFSQLYSSLTLA